MKATTLTAWAVIILGSYYFAHGEPYLARQYAYPLNHRAAIEQATATNEVPVSLVASVILAESKYNESAESNRGALGLMQLMPDTAHWIAEQMNQPTMTDSDIKEPNTSIKLGTWYLGYLLEEFRGNKILALAAYNAGRGHVESWMEEKEWKDDFDDISAIPFPETRNYVKSVLKNQERYEDLYGNNN